MKELLAQMQDYQTGKTVLEFQAMHISGLFKKYIADKGIPLVQRWSFFINASDDFKNHWNDIAWTDNPGIRWLIEHRDYERYRTVDISREFEDDITSADKGVTYNLRTVTGKYDMPHELLEDALEEVLTTNTGSFVFDW